MRQRVTPDIADALTRPRAKKARRKANGKATTDRRLPMKLSHGHPAAIGHNPKTFSFEAR
jgi:hypothetical protein